MAVTPSGGFPAHLAISPVHVLAVVRGLVEEGTDLRRDRWRYFKSLFAVDAHEAAAVRCGLVGIVDGELRVTSAGAGLYERRLRWFPDVPANYWNDQPHVREAIAEVVAAYDQAVEPPAS